MNKKNIAVFDFDGTLTKQDSLFLFISFIFGIKRLFIGLCINFITLTLYTLRLKDNGEAKEILFSYFFKNMPINKFNDYCLDFANKYKHSLMRDSMMSKLKEHLRGGDKVYILTASIINWVSPFFYEYPEIKVLGTEIEIDDKVQLLTGNFSTKNCYGQEKVNRLLQEIKNREEYYIFAYGDSKGDRELINNSDVGQYYKKNDEY